MIVMLMYIKFYKELWNVKSLYIVCIKLLLNLVVKVYDEV